jgi:AP2-associated kinase
MTASQSHIPRPSPSPMRGTTGDPFSALDSNSHSGALDDAASRFPSLEQFSLLHDHGTKFDFDTALSATASKPKDLCMLVTEKLADEAFVTPPNKASAPLSQGIPSSSSMSRAQMIISSTPALQEVVATSTVPIQQPEPNRPIMVSQGTMTSPTPPPPPETQLDDYTPPIYRFPPLDHHRSSSLPRDHIMAPSRSPRFRSDERFLHKVTTHSTLQTQSVSQGKQASSSRPSLEGGRPSSDSMKPIKRTQSGNVQSRTSTSFLESNMDYLRDREFANSKMGLLSKPASSHSKKSSLEIDVSGESDSEGEGNIESHVEFLRTMEDQEAGRRRDRRVITSNKQAKRSSLPSVSLSGTKNLLAGKFGDAFKRFESNSGVPPPPRTPSPLLDLDLRELTPIAGSEATDGRSDDGQVPEETEDMSPEIRRELERRRLSLEDKRVVNAGAEFRKRLAGQDTPKSIGGITKAVSIQNKVKNLLDENQKPSPTKTAEGYGRYTDSVSSSQGRVSEDNSTNTFPKPVSARKPLTSSSAGVPSNRRQHPSSVTEGTLAFGTVRSVPTKPPSSPSLSSTHPQKTGPRPSAPPKPTHLNGIPTGPSVSNSNANSFSSSPPKPQLAAGGPRPPPRLDVPPGENNDYINFSKRFPSLSGIEMVVTDLGADKTGAGRTKET